MVGLIQYNTRQDMDTCPYIMPVRREVCWKLGLTLSMRNFTLWTRYLCNMLVTVVKDDGIHFGWLLTASVQIAVADMSRLPLYQTGMHGEILLDSQSISVTSLAQHQTSCKIQMATISFYFKYGCTDDIIHILVLSWPESCSIPDKWGWNYICPVHRLLWLLLNCYAQAVHCKDEWLELPLYITCMAQPALRLEMTE